MTKPKLTKQEKAIVLGDPPPRTVRLTVKELAWLLGKSSEYVYLMRAAGYPKKKLMDAAAAQAWIDRHGFTKVGNSGRVRK